MLCAAGRPRTASGFAWSHPSIFTMFSIDHLVEIPSFPLPPIEFLPTIRGSWYQRMGFFTNGRSIRHDNGFIVPPTSIVTIPLVKIQVQMEIDGRVCPQKRSSSTRVVEPYPEASRPGPQIKVRSNASVQLAHHLGLFLPDTWLRLQTTRSSARSCPWILWN